MPKRMRLPNGFGQISELKGRRLRNRFRAMVTKGWTTEGKPIRKTVGYFKTYNEAYTALIKYHATSHTQYDDITMQELFEIWKGEYEKRNTIRNIHTSAWKRCETIYNIKVKDINAILIKKVVEADMPPSMHQRVKNILALVLDLAVEYDIIQKNYARTTTLFVEHDNKHHSALSENIIKELWTKNGTLYADIILILCYTGFRPNELLSLKISNIDLDNWTMIGGMKTKAGKDRIVPIHDRIKPLIEYYYDASHETLFDVPYEALNRHCKNITDGHTPHDCRATFITRMKAANANEYAIKRIVGHKITDLTEDVYTTRPVSWLKEELSKIS